MSYGQPDHDHPEYASGRDLDSTRWDLERRVEDVSEVTRAERRETREELLSEIQGLREYVNELESRVASLERIAGQLSDQHV